jgi:hypothetical protein
MYSPLSITGQVVFIENGSILWVKRIVGGGFNMKYPIAIQSNLNEVKEALKSWPVDMQLIDVIKWIMQFDPLDFDLAIRVIKNLNVIGYDDLKNALSVAYSKLVRKSVEKGIQINARNTLFAGLGDAGKSGAMVSYNFRLINELSEENFQDNEAMEGHIQAGHIENIVLVDDVISTGMQATKSIKELTEKVTPYGVKNIFLLTICGFKEGIAKVEEETKAYTFSAFEYDRQDSVTSLDSSFYEGIPFEERQQIYNRLKEYGSICYRSNPLGYGSIGALMVFYYNTPNTTLPIIWSDRNSWIPLFRRARKINGITSYYKQFDSAIKSKTEKIKREGKVTQVKATELSIFVEGKTEEMFFEMVFRIYKLNEILGYDNVNVIALGGAVLSEKLVNKLAGMEVNSVFVFEKEDFDSQRMHGRIRPQILDKIHKVFLDPNLMQFFDLKKAYDAFGLFNKMPDIDWENISPKVYYEFENILLRRNGILMREKRLKELIPDFIIPEKLIEFISRLKNIVEPSGIENDLQPNEKPINDDKE